MTKPPKKNAAAVELGRKGGEQRRKMPKAERVRLATLASKAAKKARAKRKIALGA